MSQPVRGLRFRPAGSPEGPPPAFEVAPDFTFRPELVSRASLRRRALHASPTRSAPEARWSDGVPVTAPDFVFTHRAFVGIARTRGDQVNARAVRMSPRPSARRPSSSSFAIGMRIGDSSSRASCRTTRSPVRTSRDLERRHRQPEDGAPIGSGPFLVEHWERGRAAALVRNPRYWGPYRAYLDRFIASLLSVQGQPGVRSRRGRSRHRRGDVDFAPRHRDRPELRRRRGSQARHGSPERGWEHFAIRIGPGGHPALRNKLVRRALAYGIDRAALVRQVLGELVPRSPAARQRRLPDDRAASTAPSWSRYRTARRRPDGCSSRPAAGAEPTASTSAAVSGCRFASFRPPAALACGFDRARSRHSYGPSESTSSSTLRAAYDGLRTDAPAGRLRRRRSSPGSASPVLARAVVHGCGGEQLSPATASGWSRATSTRPPDPRREQRARVLNRADRRFAKDVPADPALPVPAVLAYKTTIRDVSSPDRLTFWNAENWWLDRLALAAALAVSLLAVSGAGGAARSRRRSAAARWSSRTQPEPACLNPFHARCVAGRPDHAAHLCNSCSSRPSTSAPDFTWRPRLVSSVDVHEEAAVHARPIAFVRRLAGATGFRSPLATSSSPSARSEPRVEARPHVHRQVRSVTAVDAKTLRVVLRLATRSLARALRGHPPGPRPARRGPHDGLEGPDRQPARPARRSEAGRSSSSAGSAAASSCSAQPALLGAAPRLRRPARAPLRRRPAELDEVPRAASSTSRRFPRSFVAELTARARDRVFAVRRHGLEHFAFRMARVAIRRFGNKLVRRALAFGIDRVALVRAVFGPRLPRPPRRPTAPSS